MELQSPDASIPKVPTDVDGLGLPTSESRAALIKHYLHSILPIQYPSKHHSIKDFMSRTIQNSQAARDAACLLSILHIHHTCCTPVNFTAVNAIYHQLHLNLFTGLRTYTEADAITGLHVVSGFLFSGARRRVGDVQWLDIARQFALNVLNDPNMSGPEEALRWCSKSTQFIVKTMLWLDVLATVTTQEVPRFLEHLRLLLDAARIEEGTSGVPEILMPSIVGCEMHIVLAITEISNLAHWKESCLREGTLSVPDLERQGALIEDQLLGRGSQHTTGSPHYPESEDPQTLARQMSRRSWRGRRSRDEVDRIECQRLTNKCILRASAKVYLHTVLSGDLGPGVTSAVAEMIELLQKVLEQPLRRNLVGSMAFGVWGLAGCQTDDSA